MDFILFFLLGILDILAILSLIFKIFRFPILEFKKKFLIIALTLSMVSFFNRFIFEIPVLDMGMQFILFTMFLRYLIKFRAFESLMLSAVGFLFFGFNQLLTAKALLYFNVISLEVIKQSTGLIFLVQLVNDCIVFLCSWMLYRFHLGFSFVMKPPHDLYLKNKALSRDVLTFISVLLGSIIVFATLFILFNYFNEAYIILIAILLVLGLLMLVLNKKDLEDE